MHTTAQQTLAQGEQRAAAELKAEWGQAFDRNLDAAKRALAHHGDDKLTAYLEASKLGNHPGMVRLFARLGAQLAEDGIIGRGGGDAGALSSAEARQQIAGKYGDAAWMKSYADKAAPGHAQAVAEMARLHAFAYPSG